MCNQEKDSLQNKVKRYSSLKYTLEIIDIIYLLILLFFFQGLGLSQALARGLSESLNNYIIIHTYIFLVYIVYYFLNFPLNFYQSFILERKFCLSNQKVMDWFKDEVKAWIVSYVIALILIGAFYYILSRFAHTWWLVISLFWIFFSLILAKLVPVIIIPLFFRYKVISDNILRDRIINLAKNMRVGIMDVFEIDFSKKTLKANAALAGWGKTRRVILADTLKDKYSYDEIEVVLAHEFAHYRLKHIFKIISVNSIAIILSFYLIFKTSNYFLGLFGFSSLLDIAALPTIIMYIVISGIILQPLQNYISCRLERNADIMALKVTGLKEAFVSMMEKLYFQNLADRNPHPIIKFFFFDHPSINERIAIAKSLS